MTKPIRWSLHAIDALVDRGIERSEAERAVAWPEFVVPDVPPREICMRRYFAARLGQQMLLRVVVEVAAHERVVVTVYKISQVRKYLKGLVP